MKTELSKTQEKVASDQVQKCLQTDSNLENSPEKPHLVHSHDVQIDAEYTQWLVELKERYRSAQIKAAVKVNAEKLLFNWQLGRDLVLKKAEERWGAQKTPPTWWRIASY